MRSELTDALYRVSLFTSPEPEIVFQQILDVIGELYSNTMAMVNVRDGDCVRSRMVVNPHAAFQGRDTLDLQRTLCRFPLSTARPLLVQNAKEDPDFCRHIIVRLKLKRYLGVPICISSGDAVGTLCFLDDRTDEKLGDEDIRFLSLLAMRVGSELERERATQSRIALVAEQARQLEDINARLKAKAEEKRHFVNMVIHDLRHPLTAMRTTLHLLRTERDPKQRRADIVALENRTRALATLLEELVLYDQIEAGQSMLKPEAIDVGAFVAACVDEVAGQTETRTVAVHCEIAPDVGTVMLDGRKLRHILLNLVANALKFTHEGEVTVRARVESPTHWRMEVEDTGVGMTSLERERAFDEYFSGTSRDHEGIGLGLAIAQRLCTVLQAKVSLRSKPGEGTCFQLVFPRRLASPDETEPADVCAARGMEANSDPVS